MFICNSCGYSSIAWMGKCPQCGSFDIIEQHLPKKNTKRNSSIDSTEIEIQQLDVILNSKDSRTSDSRLSTGFSEVDNVLNQIVTGGVYLLGGEPGVGKSTLALQILGNVARKYKSKVLYVTGEESAQQVSLRAKRLLDNTVNSAIDIVSSNNLGGILESIKQEYRLIVFDSMQAFQIVGNTGIVGGVSQVRDVVYRIVQFAKMNQVPVIIIGQITKEGVIAGPKLAEHLVDVVAYLENLGGNNVRIIRVIKNRFGEVGNIGFIKMGKNGFIDAPNVYYDWINSTETNSSGSTYGVVMYGIRPLIVQVQTLIVDTKFSNPKRVVEGVSKSKLELLVAVINKHVPGIDLSFKDIFVKLIGGVHTKDSCIDLAIIASLLSSYKNKPFEKLAFVGEVGLLGDIKECSFLSSYKKEAQKLGFSIIGKNARYKHVKDLLKLLK